MGFNLGALAGGVAQGAEAGMSLKMKRDELDSNKEFQNRRLKIAESEESRTADTDARRKQEADDQAAIVSRYKDKLGDNIFGSDDDEPAAPTTQPVSNLGGPAPAQQGYTPAAAGPDGPAPGVATAPAPMPAAPGGNLGSYTPANAGPDGPAPGVATDATAAVDTSAPAGAPAPKAKLTGDQRTAAQMGLMTELMMNKIKHGADPKALAELIEYGKKMKGQQDVQLVTDAIFNHSQDAIDKLKAKHGATKFELKQDPQTGITMLDFGNGQPPQDVSTILKVASAIGLENTFSEQDARRREGVKGVQSDETHKSNMRAADDTHTEAGSKLENDKADRAYKGSEVTKNIAQAGYYNESRKGAALARISDSVAKEIEKTPRVMSASDEKSEWAGPKNFLATRAGQGEMSTQRVFLARQEMGGIMTDVEQRLSKLMSDPDKDKAAENRKRLAATWGSSNPQVILQRAQDAALQRAANTKPTY